LVVLLAPLIHSAPQPLHSHDPPAACDTTICRVSDQSLDSALSTFLCFTEDETSAMDEIDKKRELAAAIAPYIDGSREDELVALGSESLVSLVNLVLHAGSDKVVKKTKQQHHEELINSVTSAGNRGLKLEFYKNVDPILLGIINCQSITIAQIHELIAPVAGKPEDRDGRGAILNKFISSITGKFQDLKTKPEKTSLLADKSVADLKGLAGKLSLPEGVSMHDKLGLVQKLDVANNGDLAELLAKPDGPGYEVPEIPGLQLENEREHE